jgi:hypothetical protein
LTEAAPVRWPSPTLRAGLRRGASLWRRDTPLRGPGIGQRAGLSWWSGPFTLLWLSWITEGALSPPVWASPSEGTQRAMDPGSAPHGPRVVWRPASLASPVGAAAAGPRGDRPDAAIPARVGLTHLVAPPSVAPVAAAPGPIWPHAAVHSAPLTAKTTAARQGVGAPNDRASAADRGAAAARPLGPAPRAEVRWLTAPVAPARGSARVLVESARSLGPAPDAEIRWLTSLVERAGGRRGADGGEVSSAAPGRLTAARGSAPGASLAPSARLGVRLVEAPRGVGATQRALVALPLAPRVPPQDGARRREEAADTSARPRSSRPPDGELAAERLTTPGLRAALTAPRQPAAHPQGTADRPLTRWLVTPRRAPSQATAPLPNVTTISSAAAPAARPVQLEITRWRVAMSRPTPLKGLAIQGRDRAGVLLAPAAQRGEVVERALRTPTLVSLRALPSPIQAPLGVNGPPSRPGAQPLRDPSASPARSTATPPSPRRRPEEATRRAGPLHALTRQGLTWISAAKRTPIIQDQTADLSGLDARAPSLVSRRPPLGRATPPSPERAPQTVLVRTLRAVRTALVELAERLQPPPTPAARRSDAQGKAPRAPSGASVERITPRRSPRRAPGVSGAPTPILPRPPALPEATTAGPRSAPEAPRALALPAWSAERAVSLDAAPRRGAPAPAPSPVVAMPLVTPPASRAPSASTGPRGRAATVRSTDSASWRAASRPQRPAPSARSSQPANAQTIQRARLPAELLELLGEAQAPAPSPRPAPSEPPVLERELVRALKTMTRSDAQAVELIKDIERRLAELRRFDALRRI